MESYSVLMSVYEKEQAEYFRASILSMLNQSVLTDDFVIMCDGPLTEEVEEVLAEMKQEHPDLFRIVHLDENRGLGIALQKGVTYCKNELIARMDSDDISVPDRCEKQLAVFANQDVDIVGGNIEEFVEDISKPTATRKVPCTDAEIKAFAKRRNPFNHPTIMFRKSAVKEAGNYEDCKGFEDYYLWARMLKCGMRGCNLPETLVYMRTSAGMYARRGSLSYAVLGVKARWKIHRIGFSSLTDFLISAGGQVVMSIVPLRMRQFFYGKFLRK